MSRQIVTVLLIFSSLCVPCDFLLEKKTIQMDRIVGRCPGLKNATIFFDNISFNHVKTNFLYGMRMTVKRDTSSNLKTRMLLDRCKSKEALDTCEPYPPITVSNYCFLIQANVPPFSENLERVTPRLSCPIKKGVYVLKNGTVSESALAMFPVENYYFRVHSYIMDKIDGDYQDICCAYGEGKIINI